MTDEGVRKFKWWNDSLKSPKITIGGVEFWKTGLLDGPTFPVTTFFKMGTDPKHKPQLPPFYMFYNLEEQNFWTGWYTNENDYCLKEIVELPKWKERWHKILRWWGLSPKDTARYLQKYPEWDFH